MSLNLFSGYKQLSVRARVRVCVCVCVCVVSVLYDLVKFCKYLKSRFHSMEQSNIHYISFDQYQLISTLSSKKGQHFTKRNFVGDIFLGFFYEDVD